MKKAFLLFVALVGTAHATDVAMNCGQQGFQVSAQLGYGLTSASNNCDMIVDNELMGTPGEVLSNFNETFLTPPDGTSYDNYIYKVGLDYGNLPAFQGASSISAGLSLGYKWLLNCNQYSITSNAFIQYNGASLYSDLSEKSTNFEVAAATSATIAANNYKYVNGSIGTDYSNIERVTLTSGPVFGFNFLLAKEFNWGNAGLLLGMKFNTYKIKYFEVDPIVVEPGVVLKNGYLDGTVQNASGTRLNGDVSLNIGDLSEITDRKVATGFTVGFSSNYYISDNLSAGLTVFYDMYAPVTFNIDVNTNPYTIETDEGNPVGSEGKIKFQNNHIGVLMNLTYSFGAN